MVALIKPQFEAGREKVGKHGIIHDPKVHEEVINMIINFAVENQYDVCDLDFSPITGGHGNIEFLIHLRAVDQEGKLHLKLIRIGLFNRRMQRYRTNNQRKGINMLQELRIKDFAIIEEADIDFQAGMTVLTGETGAGKSIIIDALGLLAGGRGSVDFIRKGAAKAVLQGQFVLPASAPVFQILDDLGIDHEIKR